MRTYYLFLYDENEEHFSSFLFSEAAIHWGEAFLKFFEGVGCMKIALRVTYCGGAMAPVAFVILLSPILGEKSNTFLILALYFPSRFWVVGASDSWGLGRSSMT